jgi:catechol 2,3-dioxygenase-like lactoylglutathione lyase family enzyme
VAQDHFDHIFIEPSSYDASLAFYRDGLGWQVAFSWGGGGEPRGVCLGSGSMRVVLAEPHPASDKSKSHGINGTRPTVHLRVTDIDARYAELDRQGLAQFPPEATHWGTPRLLALRALHALMAFGLGFFVWPSLLWPTASTPGPSSVVHALWRYVFARYLRAQSEPWRQGREGAA